MYIFYSWYPSSFIYKIFFEMRFYDDMFMLKDSQSHIFLMDIKFSNNNEHKRIDTKTFFSYRNKRHFPFMTCHKAPQNNLKLLYFEFLSRLIFYIEKTFFHSCMYTRYCIARFLFCEEKERQVSTQYNKKRRLFPS